MGSFTSSPKELPDQPVPTVDPEVERLACERLGLERAAAGDAAPRAAGRVGTR